MGPDDYKKPVKQILQSCADNKSFIKDVSAFVDASRGVDAAAAEKIVKMGYVQTQIIKSVDASNGSLTQNDLENRLKTIFIKAWADNGIIGTAIEKTKKDIK